MGVWGLGKIIVPLLAAIILVVKEQKTSGESHIGGRFGSKVMIERWGGWEELISLPVLCIRY